MLPTGVETGSPDGEKLVEQPVSPTIERTLAAESRAGTTKVTRMMITHAG
jgi:hypothetical protein